MSRHTFDEAFWHDMGIFHSPLRCTFCENPDKKWGDARKFSLEVYEPSKEIKLTSEEGKEHILSQFVNGWPSKVTPFDWAAMRAWCEMLKGRYYEVVYFAPCLQFPNGVIAAYSAEPGPFPGNFSESCVCSWWHWKDYLGGKCSGNCCVCKGIKHLFQ